MAYQLAMQGVGLPIQVLEQQPFFFVGLMAMIILINFAAMLEIAKKGFWPTNGVMPLVVLTITIMALLIARHQQEMIQMKLWTMQTIMPYFTATVYSN